MNSVNPKLLHKNLWLKNKLKKLLNELRGFKFVITLVLYQEVGSGWNIHSAIEQNINVSKNKPLSGSCYTKLPKELNHSRKGLVNIQNSDHHEFLKWCLVRYLNPADHHPVRIRKIVENFLRKLDFRSIKFPVKLEILKK